jgi:hypothetical protein
MIASDLIAENKQLREQLKAAVNKLMSMPLKPKELTLTDDEIDMLVHEYNCIDDFPHEFVRACLKKAQSK